MLCLPFILSKSHFPDHRQDSILTFCSIHLAMQYVHSSKILREDNELPLVISSLFFYFSLHSHKLSHLFSLSLQLLQSNLPFCFTVPLPLYTYRQTHMFMHTHTVRTSYFSNLFYFPYALIPTYSFPLKKAETNQANSSTIKL